MRPSLLVVVLLALGCAHVSKPWVAGHRAEQPIVCGIRDALSDASVRVLIIHGMGPQETYDYDGDLRSGLRDALDLQIEGCSGPYRIVKSDDIVHDYGGVRVCTYRAKNGKIVRTYTLLWSPLSRPYKTGALAYDWDWQFAGPRALLNRRLKQDLIDQSLSDAVLWSGGLSGKITYSVQQAICAALTEQTDLTRPCQAKPTAESSNSYLVVVTHSLGSMAFLGALRDMYMSSDTKAVAQLMVEHLGWVGMLANQIPLLALAEMYEPPTDKSVSYVFGSLQPAFGGRVEPLPIVAFSDPNDLLSYPIPDNWTVSLFPELGNSVKFINYPVRNALPILHLFSDPNKAHVGYWRNRRVIAALADGVNCATR